MAYSRLNKLSAVQNFINEMPFDMHVISAQWPLIYAYLWHLANDKSVRLRGTNANHTHLLQIVQMYFIHISTAHSSCNRRSIFEWMLLKFQSIMVISLFISFSKKEAKINYYYVLFNSCCHKWIQPERNLLYHFTFNGKYVISISYR